MIRPLQHLAFEGPRHDGRYGFGGRWIRYAYFVDTVTGPALWDASTAPLTGVPVVVTDRLLP